MCTFYHICGSIQCLSFPARDEGHIYIFATSTGSRIRTCWDDDLSGITSDIVAMPGLGQVQISAFSHCGSLLAAGSSGGYTVTVTFYIVGAARASKPRL